MHPHEGKGYPGFSGYQSKVVHIGSLALGGEYPVRVQSMTNTVTGDIRATVRQVMALAAAGCEMVRIAAPTLKEAEDLKVIRHELESSGCKVPLIADIHYLPEAAIVAAQYVHKVRINPGNYIDRPGTSRWPAERIVDEARKRLQPLVATCKAQGTVLRVGVNHGSLSQRMLNAWGNTPEGMVASALEFIGLFEDLGYTDLVISMKASSVRVTVHSTRLLAARLKERGTPYPLHLGVTEAGNGEEAMIASVAGIGTLLHDGLGDTIRVSLTGDPLQEIPLALRLRDELPRSIIPSIEETYPWDSVNYFRRETNSFGILGQDNPPVVILPLLASEHSIKPGETCPDLFADAEGRLLQPTRGDEEMDYLSAMYHPSVAPDHYIRLDLEDVGDVRPAYGAIARSIESGDYRPLVVAAGQRVSDAYRLALLCSPLIIDGLVDGLYVQEPGLLDPALELLQACGRRVTRTTYVACPSCARTGFDIARILDQIKARTSGLPGITIAVMGCIVNGPGEMQGADYGYVGSGKGKVSLYKAGKVVRRNIAEEEAVEELLRLIEDDKSDLNPFSH